jgi:glycosyltransferase involved in cell wall biosynthesis
MTKTLQRLPGAPTGNQQAVLQTGPGLQFRNALTEWDHVPSRIIVQGRDRTEPLVTIAITTFKRSSLLVEAIRSALGQRFDRPYEVIVLDNDPASEGAPALMASVPELAECAFRYFVNGENFGVFGNFNRCIQVARGEWLTILNDDDLLDDNYLDLMFREIEQRPSIDGIICLKRGVDCRGIVPDHDAQQPVELMSRRLLLGYLKSPSGIARLMWRLLGRARVERNFLFQMSRRVKTRRLFWGCMLGNGSGFLFRRSKAVEVGGFYPEEYPSADFWFYMRFAKKAHLRQHRNAGATISQTTGSISENTVMEQLKSGYILQRTIIGTEVPRWWSLLLPGVLAEARSYFAKDWGVKVTNDQLYCELGIRVPSTAGRFHKSLRFLLGGE